MANQVYVENGRQNSTYSEHKSHVPASRVWIPLPQFELVKVLRRTRHKIGHFRDVLPSQSLGLVLKKLNLTQQKQICIHSKIYYNTK